MGRTRDDIKIISENGAELSEYLKQTLPRQAQNIEIAVTTASEAVVLFCATAALCLVAITLHVVFPK